ncbi:DUF1294 domain-containing protein [Psychromonas sp. L1A2]|uniref:DUF1294 domain-containing protein n=1 Tax=Psychromonas sp. L1A2 TaxID=2686356 RepID=UPI001357FBEC
MKNLLLLLISTAYIAFIFYYQSIQWLPVWTLYLLVITNLLSFIFYGMDKLAAIKCWQRTPEKHFYCLALLSGWPASILGQIVFNHKTTKVSFRRWFYFMSLINLTTVVGYLSYWLNY